MKLKIDFFFKMRKYLKSSCNVSGSSCSFKDQCVVLRDGAFVNKPSPRLAKKKKKKSIRQ